MTAIGELTTEQKNRLVVSTGLQMDAREGDRRKVDHDGDLQGAQTGGGTRGVQASMTRKLKSANKAAGGQSDASTYKTRHPRARRHAVREAGPQVEARAPNGSPVSV